MGFWKPSRNTALELWHDRSRLFLKKNKNLFHMFKNRRLNKLGYVENKIVLSSLGTNLLVFSIHLICGAKCDVRIKEKIRD